MWLGLLNLLSKLNFKGSPFFIGIIVVLCVNTYFLHQSNKSLNEKLTACQKQSANLHFEANLLKNDIEIAHQKLSFSNAKIKELEAKSPNESEISLKMASKFEKIKTPKKDDECEKKLKFYKELIDEAGK
ncbi:MAG: hypothetical protein ACTTJC_02180 [Campylobacter sp.]